MKTIETHDLKKYYGKSKGIENLNLSVDEGDFFGFIGPNGAGKSTTIRTLLGLISPTSGCAKVFGNDIQKCKTKILTDVGFMPAEAMFYSNMKVKDCIKFSANMRNKDCADEASVLCERLQLDLNKKVDDLSLGNRKKVGIVCALQHKPKLYVLDEPTSGLDPLIQREFFDILCERNKAGATVFLSSHILSEIQRYCNRAAIIRDGGIIACDSVEVLTKTKAKRVTVYGTVDISKLSSVRDLKQSQISTSFLFSGEMKELLSVLSASCVSDLNIADTDLDEIFMHYYSGGDVQ